MVSAKWFLLALAPWFSTTLFAQNPLLDAAKLPDHLETPAVAPAPQQLSPERRGDILMARKMYREAIEAFSEGSMKDPVLRNKTGIAYHSGGPSSGVKTSVAPLGARSLHDAKPRSHQSRKRSTHTLW